MQFRKLRADEIDARVATCKQNGVSLLLFKDARCDMNVLDETVGPMNWERRHSRDNANCTVAIWDENKNQWVEKEDTGTESYTEKEKGLASDSFKRACFNWGIGRELYTAPFIWVKSTDLTSLKGENGKYKCFDSFTVTSIEYDEAGRIKNLQIKNDKTNRIVFTMGKPAPPDDFSQELASERDRKLFQDTCKLLNVEPTEILKKTGWTSGKMTVEHHGRAMILLKEIEEGLENA